MLLSGTRRINPIDLPPSNVDSIWSSQVAISEIQSIQKEKEKSQFSTCVVLNFQPIFCDLLSKVHSSQSQKSATDKVKAKNPPPPPKCSQTLADN
jgi:hypothetical protein